jgi:hypothetical protein
MKLLDSGTFGLCQKPTTFHRICGLRVHDRKEFRCHGYELAWLHADWLTISGSFLQVAVVTIGGIRKLSKN